MAKRFYSISSLNPGHTTGAWVRVTAGNVTTFDHTAAAETSTLAFEVPKQPGSIGTDNQPFKAIRVQYTVATAALSAAPTATLNKFVVDDATGVVTRTAVAQALTFEGTNTVGTANGTYFAVVTPTAGVSPNSGETYTLELAFPAAATTVLKVTGAQVDTT